MRTKSKCFSKPVRGGLYAASLISLISMSIATRAEDFIVQATVIEDQKAVFATVESTDAIAARVRISGTVTELSVTEGDLVEEGAVIAVVKDPKLDLQIDAIDAQIRAAEREIANLKTELERTQALFQRGSTTKARLDQTNTQYDVAKSKLEASEAEKAVIVRQLEEGAVLAPQSGRVLDVPITVGSVVMPGEAVATIAKDNYILRLSLPERHARFLNKGDSVALAARGQDCTKACSRTGTIAKVYPQIASGRVLADATVDGLGDYFVGERIQVRVSAGERTAFMVPKAMIFTRFGVDFVTVKLAEGKLADIAVQVGRNQALDAGVMTEILSGIEAGDILVQPQGGEHGQK